MTDQDCPICCEKFNKSTHATVVCEFSDCNFTACKSCVRSYLLGTTADPHCMNCKKSWNEKFLVHNLNRTFCEKEYKTHRKQLLIDREMSKLPETMHLAERQKLVDVEEKKIAIMTDKIKKLTKELNQCKLDRTHTSMRMYDIRNGIDQNGKTAERRKFMMACPTDNCRGFLSSQYKCELCELYTCPQCFELIGYSKTDPHECNPDSVASAEMIRKETKPCPNCAVRIFKISGCNQMWCTECKIAFNYTTGKIDTGVVHNPHYYAHIAQQQRDGVAPRNPQDVLCGGLIGLHTLQRIILNPLRLIITDGDEYLLMNTYLNDIHRVISHITYYDLARIRTDVRDLEDGAQVRVSYILGKTSKKEIGDQIYRRDLKRKKATELLHLYELLSVVGIENFAMLATLGEEIAKSFVSSVLPRRLLRNEVVAAGEALTMSAEGENFLDEVNKKIVVMDNLRDYFNTELMKISVTYNSSVLHIDDLWKLNHKKFKIGDLKNSA